MRELLPIFLLCGSGVAMAAQATLNVAMGKSQGLWLFAFMFTVVQLMATLPTLFAFAWPLNIGVLAGTPWWQYLGGVLGMPILAAMAFALARTGTFAGLIALLVGQLAMGLAIDRFGFFAAPVHPITLSRLAGFVLVIAGLLLAR